jgi:hypothetical protein
MTCYHLILFVIMLLELLIHLFMHGRPRGNFSIYRKSLDIIALLTLLYLGGFFTPKP